MDEQTTGPSTNVDLVRSLYAALERSDFDEIGRWVHPELEFVIADGPEPGVSIGLAQMEEIWRQYLSTWEGYRFVLDEVRQLDGDRVLALFHFSGRGKTSGVDLAELQSQAAAVYHIRQGKLTQIVRYWNGLAREADTT
jgi:ketosteroid isomerase-like protein